MNKPKYIDAEEFIERFGDWYTEEGTEIGFIGPIKDLVYQMPAADVVEVLRCKDCQYRYVLNRGESSICNLLDAQNNGEAYCSYGEKKDG